MEPMIGVIGVAPLRARGTPTRRTGTAATWTTATIGEGCTVYFPVGQDGAYFGLGDVHG